MKNTGRLASPSKARGRVVQAALFGLTLSIAGQAAAETNLDHDGLFGEMRKYTQGGSSPHRGGVYDHSAWTAMAVCQWFQENNFWTDGLDPKNDFNLAVTAAFMHDIGKAGDLKYALGDGAGFKPEHPNTGYRYLMGKQSFEMADGTRRFDFKTWKQQVGLSDDDYKIVALVTRIHYDFGEEVMKNWNPNSEEANSTRVRNFLSKLRHFAIMDDSPFGERLVRIVLLVSAADVRAQRKVDAHCPGFTAFDHVEQPRSGGEDNFQNWGFNDMKGRSARQFVLGQLKSVSDPIFYHGTKLQYAMDMVANGIKLLKPVNGSELGLGFYVSRQASVVNTYGDTYLEVTLTLNDAQIRECTKLEDFLDETDSTNQQKFKKFKEAYGGNTGKNGYDGWWKNHELIPFNFDPPYNFEFSWKASWTLPVCATRESFANQIKFNFIHSWTNKDPAFGTIVPLKGNPTIKRICHKMQGRVEFDCQSVDEFKRKYANEWAAPIIKRAETTAMKAREDQDKYVQCRNKMAAEEARKFPDKFDDVYNTIISSDIECKKYDEKILEADAQAASLRDQLKNPMFKNEK
jgi:hypothetical protein